jgi:hypothetical protein
MTRAHVQVPRNEFALLLKGSNLVTTDQISLVPSSHTCSSNAYDAMDITHTGSSTLTAAGAITLPGGGSIVGTHVGTFGWVNSLCVPTLVDGIPGYIMPDAACPQVGWYRLCYMKAGASIETGVSAYVQQATVQAAIPYFTNGAVHTSGFGIGYSFTIEIQLLDENNNNCCFGTKVHLALNKHGIDHSSYLYNGAGSNSPGSKVVVAGVNGRAVFSSYTIRYTAGINFYLTASVAGHSVNIPSSGVFTVRPYRLNMGTTLASEYFVGSGLTATLHPSIMVRAVDSQGNLAVGLSTLDGFHCEAQLQTGSYGTDSAYGYSGWMGGIGGATTAYLNPLSMQNGGASRPVFDGGIAVFQDLTVLSQAGRCVPHRFSTLNFSLACPSVHIILHGAADFSFFCVPYFSLNTFFIPALKRVFELAGIFDSSSSSQNFHIQQLFMQLLIIS